MRPWTVPFRLRASAALALVLALAGGAPAAARADEGDVGGRPALDTRAGERAHVSAEVAAGRRALDRRLGALGRVEAAPQTGGVADVRRADGFLTGASPADAATVALDYVRARPEVFGLDAGDVDALRLEARFTSADGITTLRWVQTVDGIAAFDTGLIAHVARDGRLISVSGGAQPDLAVDDAEPALGPGAAYGEALADAGAPRVAPAGQTERGPERETDFADGGAARLAVLAGPGGGRLVWRTFALDPDGRGYEQALDADTGAVLVRRPLTAHESRADVYDRFPGSAQGGTPVTVDLAANPRWLTDAAKLAGDFTHTYTDRNANNAADAGEDTPPSSGSDWRYPLVAPDTVTGPCPPAPAFCTWNSADASTLTLNERSSAVNLFFHANRFHDHLLSEPIGFTPASGNFEGGDRVIAENNDGSGFDNANFSTPPDGTSPRMQMFPRRSAYDLQSGHSAETVYHEYTHGLTNRLVVNAAGGSMLQGEQARSMGEGWSDWYALDFLERSGYAVDGPTAGDLSYGAYWNGTGIRTQAIDCRRTDPVAGRCAANGGAYTYQDIRTLTAPHTSGEMWSQTLWDVRRAIGSDEAERLVTAGLRLSAPNPTYVDMRDAILQADLATGATHYAQLWRAFAARGLGVSAASAGTNVSAATEAFDLPRPSVADDPAVHELEGDRDGVAEPGETVRLRPALVNTGVEGLGELSGTVSSATAGVTVTGGATTWPALATPLARADAEGDVTVTLDPSLPCGTPATLNVATTLPSGAATLPFRLRAGAPVVPSGTVWTSATPNAAIPDNNAGGVSSTITIPGPGTPVQDVEVRVDGLTHAYLGDLELFVSHDGGPRRRLMSRPGNARMGAATMTATIFDDQATSAFAGATLAQAPFTGRWRPLEALAPYEGATTAGTWTLTAIDGGPGDTGTLAGWSIGFATRSTGCEDNTAAATTSVATGVGASTATVGGAIDAAGAATDYRIVWGTTEAYGAATTVASAGAARGAVERTTKLTGLAAGTTYHYRVEALRGGEVVAAGADRTFTTSAADGDGGGGTGTGGDGSGGGTGNGTGSGTTDGGGSTAGGGTAPAGGTTPAAPRADGPGATPAPTLAFTGARTLRVTRGRVTLRLTAPPSTRGKVTLRAGRRTIGTATFTATRSGTATVAVRLSSRGRTALRKARRGRLAVTAHATAGQRIATARLTLRG